MTKRLFAEDFDKDTNLFDKETTSNDVDDDALITNLNYCMTQEELDEYGFILGDDLVLPPFDDLQDDENKDQDDNMVIDVDDPANSIAPTFTGRPPVQLYLSCNPDHLSEFQCLIRKQIELFEAKDCETSSSAKGRNRKLVYGQVGIQCVHCHYLPPKERARGAMYYPQKLPGIYQAAQILATTHLMQVCPRVPEAIKQQLLRLKQDKSTGKAPAGKEYWAQTARVLGVYEAPDGLRFERALGSYEHQPNPLNSHSEF
jgi:hypothetical protein